VKKLLSILPLVILLCFTFGCQQGEDAAEKPAVDSEAEKANIRMLFDQYAEAWESLNTDHFSEIFSDDADMVIFDAQTIHVGWEAFKELLQNSFDLMNDVNITFRDYSIKVHRSGTTAWLSTLEDAT
jgi:uncharacterized protein (TIGR02246 family)